MNAVSPYTLSITARPFPHFIFGPEESYERIGDVPNVVFPCGLIEEANGMVKLYYGAADTCIGLAEASVEDLILILMSQNSCSGKE